MKYIVIRDIKAEREIPIIFPEALGHDTVYEKMVEALCDEHGSTHERYKAVAAGEISSLCIKEGCTGNSLTLKIKSRKTQDDKLIHMYDYFRGV